ncbi:uncharacterized protein LOC128714741 [Anopheles marshallii]|uniref:uncharacterized protein LOC128714741 n=1 Tax=Anopheles marshallii TaxID=1521116 RepID=UPI00237C3E3E|nr:uncharacterized protein LOC128714741 [Anopheles marshallii]
MTNSTCAAASCSYNRRNVRKLKLDIVFHTFPRDALLRKKWVKFCGRGAEWSPKSNETICSVHFKEEDYQMAMSPLMRSSNSFRRLHLTAFPSILKGTPMPIEKRRQRDEKVRQQLLDELYSKDAQIRDNDHSYDDIYNIDNIKQKQPNPLDKPVYRLQKFPYLCMLCFKDIVEENLFSPFNSYHDDLECTLEQMYEEVTGDPMDQEERASINHLLPDKVCEDCMEALITCYQYQKQLKCLKKFATGMAYLIQGNKKPMQALYGEQDTYLVSLLQSLNICQGSEDKMTLSRLEQEVAMYRLVVPHANLEQDEVEQFIPSIPMVIDEQYDELIEEESVIDMDSISIPSVTIESCRSISPQKLTPARGRPRKGLKGMDPNGYFVCPYPDVCKLWYRDETTLQNHVRSDHKFFKCRSCGAKIKFYDLYKKHVESHAIARALLLCHNQKGSNKESKCSTCQKAFQSEELLRRHETTHSGERNYVCGTCLGVYLTDQEYSKHRCVAHVVKLSSTKNTSAQQSSDETSQA